MKKIELKILKLKNFKGIKELTIDLTEKVNIYGNNGTGKTTIFDAFCWLLFDKDSRGSSKFEVKTINNSRNIIHGLDHEVEAVLTVDGEEISLKKQYKEKFVKKRGSLDKIFDGHTTDYFFNDVPLGTKKEYVAKVENIIDEERFKLLTNPMYFNLLEWKTKRSIIIEVAGDITSEDVISSNTKLKELSTILGSHTIDEYTKMLSARKKLLNKELDSIPTRLDEINNSKAEITDTKEDIGNEIKDLKEKKEIQEEELKDIDNGSSASEKKLKISELEKEKIEFENKNSKTSLSGIKVLRDKKETLSNLGSEEKIVLNDTKNLLKTRTIELQETNYKITDTRTAWFDLNKTTFTSEDHCPTCKQHLPEDEIEKAKNNFNINKSEKLEKIKNDGIKLKETILATQESIKGLEEGEKESLKKCKDFAKEISKINNSIFEIEEKMNLFKEHADYKVICEKIQDIQEELEFSDSKSNESKKIIKEKILEIENHIQDKNRDLLKIENNEKLWLRIKELEKEQEKLSKQYEEAEKETFLTEEFIKTKVRMLEEKINSKFKYARFKMFNEQVNGGIAECCETLFENIPYDNNLNSGAKINVGLDIINTLSKHYEYLAPIFVDNKESVTKLIELEAQTINLIVSENDDILRIEK